MAAADQLAHASAALLAEMEARRRGRPKKATKSVRARAVDLLQRCQIENQSPPASLVLVFCRLVAASPTDDEPARALSDKQRQGAQIEASRPVDAPISPANLAKQLGVSESAVRKWRRDATYKRAVERAYIDEVAEKAASSIERNDQLRDNTPSEQCDLRNATRAWGALTSEERGKEWGLWIFQNAGRFPVVSPLDGRKYADEASYIEHLMSIPGNMPWGWRGPSRHGR